MDDLEPLQEPEPGLTPINTYSLEEVAGMIMPSDDPKNSVRWLTDQIRTGKASAYRVRRRWRMTHQDVEDLIARNRNRMQDPESQPDLPLGEKPLWASLSARSRKLRGLPEWP